MHAMPLAYGLLCHALLICYGYVTRMFRCCRDTCRHICLRHAIYAALLPYIAARYAYYVASAALHAVIYMRFTLKRRTAARSPPPHVADMAIARHCRRRHTPPPFTPTLIFRRHYADAASLPSPYVAHAIFTLLPRLSRYAPLLPYERRAILICYTSAAAAAMLDSRHYCDFAADMPYICFFARF